MNERNERKRPQIAIKARGGLILTGAHATRHTAGARTQREHQWTIKRQRARKRAEQTKKETLQPVQSTLRKEKASEQREFGREFSAAGTGTAKKKEKEKEREREREKEKEKEKERKGFGRIGFKT